MTTPRIPTAARRRVVRGLGAGLLALVLATAGGAGASWAVPAGPRLEPPAAHRPGGPRTAAIAEPRWINVYWAADWDAAVGDPGLRRSAIDAFSSRLAASRYFAALGQYGAGQPRFLGGEPAAAACGATAPAAVTPAVVARFVRCQVAADGRGRAAGSGNLVVVVFLPPATRSDLPAPGPCVGSDGEGPPGLFNYHGNTANQGRGPAIPFAVVAAGCALADAGGGPFGYDPFGHLTWAVTHELVEAVTDPLPGRGWVDRARGGDGEAADLCEPPVPPRPLAGGLVSPYWSNRDGACVAGPAGA